MFMKYNMTPKFPRDITVKRTGLLKFQNQVIQEASQNVNSFLIGSMVDDDMTIIVDTQGVLLAMKSYDEVGERGLALNYDIEIEEGYRRPILKEWIRIRNNILKINKGLEEAEFEVYSYIYDNREKEAWYWIHNTAVTKGGKTYATRFNTVSGKIEQVDTSLIGAKNRLVYVVDLKFVPNYSNNVNVVVVNETYVLSVAEEGKIITVTEGSLVRQVLMDITSEDDSIQTYKIQYDTQTGPRDRTSKEVVEENDVLEVLAEDERTIGNYSITIHSEE